MNIIRSWLFKLSAVGGISFGGFQYMIRTRDRPSFLPSFMDQHKIGPSRKYMFYSLTRGKNTYFDESIVRLINGFNYFEVFQSDDSPSVYCIFNASRKLQFFTKHIHEGLIAALIDNLSGFQAIIVNKAAVATATLSLDYKQPLFTDTYYLVQMKDVKIDERRSRITGQIRKIEEGAIRQEDSVSSQAIMVSINWKGLSEHDKSKREKPSE